MGIFLGQLKLCQICLVFVGLLVLIIPLQIFGKIGKIILSNRKNVPGSRPELNC